MKKQIFKITVLRNAVFYALFAVLIAGGAAGCKKDEPQLTECQKNNWGYFAFENLSNDAYDMWINGTYYRQFPANSYTTKWYSFPAGKVYYIEVQQVSGYVLYPTKKTYNITLNQCDEKWVSFP